MRIFLATAALLLATTACTATVPEPVDEPCTGQVRWSAGSMAAPWSHSWELVVHGATADFVVWPTGTDDENFRDEGFAVDEATVAAMCQALAEVPEDEDTMVGGAMMAWEIGGLDTFSTIPANFSDARARVVDVVGQERFDEGIAAYDAYLEEHQE